MINYCTYPMFGRIAIKYLNFVTVLKITPLFPFGACAKKFNVQSKIAVFLFGNYIGSAIFSIHCRWIVAVHHCSFINRILNNFPLYGQLGSKTWPFPIGLFLVEHFVRAIKNYFGFCRSFCTHSKRMLFARVV